MRHCSGRVAVANLLPQAVDQPVDAAKVELPFELILVVDAHRIAFELYVDDPWPAIPLGNSPSGRDGLAVVHVNGGVHQDVAVRHRPHLANLEHSDGGVVQPIENVLRDLDRNEVAKLLDLRCARLPSFAAQGALADPREVHTLSQDPHELAARILRRSQPRST